MRLALILVCIVLSACKNLDVVEMDYPDLHAARADSLFRRGWLPDILPDSTHSINCRNNLDRNTSEGSFRIRTEDASEFSSKLKECMKSAIDIEEFSGLGKQGFRPQCYRLGGNCWVFYLNWDSGHCIYRLIDEADL